MKWIPEGRSVLFFIRYMENYRTGRTVGLGLLRRESVSSDARLKRLVLTEEGREINNNALAERKELENRIRKGLSDEEFDTLMRLLRKVADNMHEE